MSLAKILEGKEGELIASLYLQKQGYIILEKNFRKRYGELDIVALEKNNDKKNQTLVFVEVKTRKSVLYGSPYEAITSKKLKSLVKTAQYYKLIHPRLPENLRIDAISVLLSLSGEVKKIEHIKNISGF